LLTPRGIDAAGRVLGNRAGRAGCDEPFLAASNDQIDLLEFAAPARVSAFGGFGAVVGRWTGEGAGRALKMVDGVVSLLPLPDAFDDETTRSFAGAAYADGRIAGWMIPEEGGAIPLVWQDGEVRVLPSLGNLTHGYPASMLDDGSIAGEARGTDGGFYPICWRNDAAEVLATPHGYGRVLAGCTTQPAHLGSAWTGHRFEATIWRPDGYQVLPGLAGEFCESAAFGLNAAGTAIGITYRTPSRGDWVATRWQQGEATALQDLIEPGSGVQLISANAINDADQIAAAAIWPDRSLHAVRLDPR
jgi:hypothetical protein